MLLTRMKPVLHPLSIYKQNTNQNPNTNMGNIIGQSTIVTATEGLYNVHANPRFYDTLPVEYEDINRRVALLEAAIDTTKVNLISSTDTGKMFLVHQYLHRSVLESQADATPDVFWHWHRYAAVEPVIEYWGAVNAHWRQHSAAKPFLGLYTDHSTPQGTTRKRSIHVFDDLRYAVDIEMALDFINTRLRHDKLVTVIVVTSKGSRMGAHFDKRVREVLSGHINELDSAALLDMTPAWIKSLLVDTDNYDENRVTEWLSSNLNIRRHDIVRAARDGHINYDT